MNIYSRSHYEAVSHARAAVGPVVTVPLGEFSHDKKLSSMTRESAGGGVSEGSQLWDLLQGVVARLVLLLKRYFITVPVIPVQVDRPSPVIDISPAAPASSFVSSKKPGERPDDIWGGFYQTVEGNCVTVSAIKASMMKFGQNPLGIYREIKNTDKGYAVTMRDDSVVHLTHEELEKATQGSHFAGNDKGMLKDANFLYAVSAKRAQRENHEGAGDSFEAAMESLNNGEGPGAAFKRLGLFGHIRHATMEELAGGALGTLAYDGHSVAVIGGHEERYGIKGAAPPLHRRLVAEYQGIKLV